MKEKESFIKIIMNPVRQRIIQYLALHKTGTAGEIGKELSDIPPATLYRHLRVLLEAGLLETAEERKVRGTWEKIYRLTPDPLAGEDLSQKEAALLIQSGLMGLMESFQRYFAAAEPDPQKDLLSLTTSTLLLSDEEFMEVLQKIAAILHQALGNPPAAGRKQRRLTLISSPCEEEDEALLPKAEKEKK